AGHPQLLDHPLEERTRHGFSDLHLKLPEPGRDPSTGQNRDLVIRDVGEERSVAIHELHPPSQRLKPRHGLEGSRTNTRPSEVDGLCRRTAGVPTGERVLTANKQLTVVLDRKLQCPSLSGSDPKAHPPASEPK